MIWGEYDMNTMQKVHYGVDFILIIIVILLLGVSCQATKTNQVTLETYKEKQSSNPKDWENQEKKLTQVLNGFSDLLNTVSPEDLCRPQYQNEIDQMGIRFINAGNEGKKLVYTGDGNMFPNYTKYIAYFDYNITLGNQVRTLSNTIKDGKYADAVQQLAHVIDRVDQMEVF